MTNQPPERRLPTAVEAGLHAKISILERINADLIEQLAMLELQINIMSGQVELPSPPAPEPEPEG